jgi:hypothetical protein
VRLPDGQRSRAVLIGTSLAAEPGLTELPAVRNNLDGLATVLTDPEYSGLPPEHCSALLDQTDVALLGEQSESAASQAEDLLLVYYAGHGLVDVKGKLYLALPGTRRDRLTWTGLPFSHVQDVMPDSAAANQVLVLDCCLAERAIEARSDPKSVVSGQIDIAGACTLTSTSANAVSHARLHRFHPTAARRPAARLRGAGRVAHAEHDICARRWMPGPSGASRCPAPQAGCGRPRRA